MSPNTQFIFSTEKSTIIILKMLNLKLCITNSTHSIFYACSIVRKFTAGISE